MEVSDTVPGAVVATVLPRKLRGPCEASSPGHLHPYDPVPSVTDRISRVLSPFLPCKA